MSARLAICIWPMRVPQTRQAPNVDTDVLTFATRSAVPQICRISSRAFASTADLIPSFALLRSGQWGDPLERFLKRLSIPLGELRSPVERNA